MQGDAGTLAAFTETSSIIDDMIVDGDTGVLRWSWEATHSGPLESLGIPATGKRVRMQGCSIYRFRDGKIAEQWEYGDVLGLLQQLGVIPALG
jgi:predicted ester cyclase